jgi:hypothetical protein
LQNETTVKPVHRNTLITLLIVAAFAAGYYAGYIMAYYPATIRHSRERRELLNRISEYEAREKRGPSPATAAENAPTN